jgi:transposase
VPKRLGQDLVPEGLWKIVEPLIPPQRERPQGGGTWQVDDRAVLTAIVYVLTTGYAWRRRRGDPGGRWRVSPVPVSPVGGSAGRGRPGPAARAR